MATHNKIASTISKLLRIRAEIAPVKELKKRGIRNVRIVRPEQLAVLIEDALEDVIDTLRQESADLGRAIAEADQQGKRDFGRGIEVSALMEVIDSIGVTSVGHTQQIAAAVSSFMKTEEARMRVEAESKQKERIELLEARLARLNVALAETEKELRLALERANQEPGISSIYKSLEGIRDTAKDFQRKWALLADIYKKNLELQKAGDGSKAGDGRKVGDSRGASTSFDSASASA
jgi:hypothetical protein